MRCAMSHDTQEISLKAPTPKHPLIQRGTVANLLAPALNQLAPGGYVTIPGRAITIPWDEGPGVPADQVNLCGPGLRVGEIYSLKPDARVFRLETTDRKQEFYFCFANGEAWPVYLDRF